MSTRTRKKDLPNKIFIDADILVAVADKDDANHKKALKIARLLDSRKISVFTSNFAFGEAITVTSQKMGIETAVRMGHDIQQGPYTIIDVNRQQREIALERFSRQTSKNTRFTDILNMVLMDELGIKTIFSFDKHYPKSGYNLL